MDQTEFGIAGETGHLHAVRWTADAAAPDYVALLVHGYGEHCGRYEHVAQRLVDDGAVVYALDHVGHGRSEGERVLIEDFDPVVADVHRLELSARGEHPALPVVLVGHSMGGMIAARYAQRYGDGLAAVVLSGPSIGTLGIVDVLLGMDEIPDIPIDPAVLSRDPAVGEAYAADPLVWHGPFKRPTLLAFKACQEAITASGAFDGPVLWIHGEADQLVPIDGSRLGWATFAGSRAQAKSYPDARHEIFNETNKDEVLDDVLAFVHAHLPAG